MNKEELKTILENHEEWLNGEGGERANLSGADLSWADLSEANLRRANLSRTNLREADLSWADLSEVNLSRADLSEANLRRANLSRTNLREADLSRVDLSWANLSRADLSEAKVYNTIGDGVIIRSAQFPRYTVVIVDDWLQIGCKGYRVHEWAEFDDETISVMDIGALKWRKENKDAVLAFAGWPEYVGVGHEQD